MADNKGRVLCLEHYLLDRADEQHPATTDELIAALAERGYSANRNTLRSDIDALRAEGVEATGVRVGNAKGYYIKNRPFTVSELRALIDAVSSSQFISARNSRALIRRLADMAPEAERKDLTVSAFCTARVKTDSPVAFSSLDTVSRAIRGRKKLSFRYVDYLPDKSEILRHDGKLYTVSPYALLWNDGRYYVPSYDPEKGKIVSYRVDRMRNVMVVNAAAEPGMKPDLNDYSMKTLWMYEGDRTEREVALISENRHMISLIDRFGNGFRADPADENHFRALIKVIPSATFFSWIFQFSGGIRIAGPADVKREYEEMLAAVTEKQR